MVLPPLKRQIALGQLPRGQDPTKVLNHLINTLPFILQWTERGKVWGPGEGPSQVTLIQTQHRVHLSGGWFHKKHRSADVADEPVYSMYVHKIQVVKLCFYRKPLIFQFEKLNPKIFSPPFLGSTGDFLYKAFIFMCLLWKCDFLFFFLLLIALPSVTL